jgi:hypothetical protein
MRSGQAQSPWHVTTEGNLLSREQYQDQCCLVEFWSTSLAVNTKGNGELHMLRAEQRWKGSRPAARLVLSLHDANRGGVDENESNEHV